MCKSEDFSARCHRALASAHIPQIENNALSEQVGSWLNVGRVLMTMRARIQKLAANTSVIEHFQRVHLQLYYVSKSHLNECLSLLGAFYVILQK